ncbi:MAG: serpin family protein [Acidimicrobiales bacterium]|nr:serpin family protein [Acidimicrobiales bacterium]
MPISETRPTSWATRLMAVLTVLMVVAAACSSDDGDETSPTSGPQTTTSVVPPAGDGLEFISADVDREDPSSVPSADVAAVVAGDADLGFELLRKAGTEGDNVFLSPYSVATALGMLLPGARGATQEEIASVLGATTMGEAYHRARGALDAAVLEPGTPPPEGEAESFTLRAANQLFGQQGFPFSDEYLELLARSYGAEFGVVDYATEPEPARMLINDWVEGQTEDRIVDLIPEGVITTLTRLVLVNAVYFKANWMETFDPTNTTQASFTDLDGAGGPVETMNGSITTGYVDGDGFDAVRLAYAGGTTSMLVIVPDEGSFADVQASLDADELDRIRADLGRAQVQLAMPTFEFRTALGLKPLLQELGMQRAFLEPGPDGADLTGITPEQILFVQDALHQAFVSVDEEGTEAAAATAIVVGLESAPEPVTLTIDRPFLFVIQHDATGEPVFMGQVTNLVDS